MKKFTKSQTLEHKNSPACAVTEYPFLDDTIDFAIAKISGRYPEQKYAVNQKCKEAVFVQEGSGKVEVNGEEHFLKAGDLVFIEPEEKFSWDGMMTLIISCRPAWTKEQHQLVD